MSRPERLIIEADGAARGNPGMAGAGVIIKDEHGHRLEAIGKFLGVSTNNQAEYQALIAGLEAASKHNPEAVTIRMDSELVVKHMNGEYRVRSPEIFPLYSRAMELAAGLPELRVEHVAREKNSSADRLANLAIDTRGRRTTLE